MWRVGLYSSLKAATQDKVDSLQVQRELRTPIDVRERLAALEARRS